MAWHGECIDLVLSLGECNMLCDAHLMNWFYITYFCVRIVCMSCCENVEDGSVIKIYLSILTSGWKVHIINSMSDTMTYANHSIKLTFIRIACIEMNFYTTIITVLTPHHINHTNNSHPQHPKKNVHRRRSTLPIRNRNNLPHSLRLPQHPPPLRPLRPPPRTHRLQIRLTLHHLRKPTPNLSGPRGTHRTLRPGIPNPPLSEITRVAADQMCGVSSVSVGGANVSYLCGEIAFGGLWKGAGGIRVGCGDCGGVTGWEEYGGGGEGGWDGGGGDCGGGEEVEEEGGE